eukprot:scaffold2562_cov116-Isochrysis_galbana.AAC.5
MRLPVRISGASQYCDDAPTPHPAWRIAVSSAPNMMRSLSSSRTPPPRRAPRHVLLLPRVLLLDINSCSSQSMSTPVSAAENGRRRGSDGGRDAVEMIIACEECVGTSDSRDRDTSS